MQALPVQPTLQYTKHAHVILAHVLTFAIADSFACIAIPALLQVLC